jgi:hypothetical protein
MVYAPLIMLPAKKQFFGVPVSIIKENATRVNGGGGFVLQDLYLISLTQNENVNKCGGYAVSQLFATMRYYTFTMRYYTFHYALLHLYYALLHLFIFR